MLSKTPIHDLADLRGKKLRVLPSPTVVRTFRLLDATPVPMNFSEVYTSLQTGVIDGLEHDAPTILQSRFSESAKNLELTQHIFDPAAPIISSATLKRLSDSQQQAVPHAAAAAAATAMEQLTGDGVQIIDVDHAPLVNAGRPLWNSFTGQHPETKPVLQAILSATVFSGISGSKSVDVAAVGSIMLPAMRQTGMLPAMRQTGYDEDDAVPLLAASAVKGGKPSRPAST